MINKINNKYYINGTSIEVVSLTRNEQGKQERTTSKILAKNTYYKINMLKFKSLEFKTIAQCKQFLKSETTIQGLLDNCDIDENIIDMLNIKIDTHKDTIITLQRLTTKLSDELVQVKQTTKYDKLNERQRKKMNKWTTKNNTCYE